MYDVRSSDGTFDSDRIEQVNADTGEIVSAHKEPLHDRSPAAVVRVVAIKVESVEMAQIARVEMALLWVAQQAPMDQCFLVPEVPVAQHHVRSVVMVDLDFHQR